MGWQSYWVVCQSRSLVSQNTLGPKVCRLPLHCSDAHERIGDDHPKRLSKQCGACREECLRLRLLMKHGGGSLMNTKMVVGAHCKGRFDTGLRKGSTLQHNTCIKRMHVVCKM